MKKFRFLSSLTLASAIVSGVTVVSLAAGTTASTGVLKKGTLPNVLDKDVVGYLLTDANDNVTVEEILNAGKYTNVKINGNTNNASKTDTVTTGDNFTAGNKDEKRHVVVYNEVNRDGKVDIDDVTDALDIVIGSKKDAEDLQKEAADVKHDGTLDIDDVTRILDFVIGAEKTPIDPVPQGVDDVDELKYDITVNDGKGVNKKTLASSDVKVSLKSGSAEDRTTIKLVYVDDNGEEQPFNKNAIIEKHATQNQTAVTVNFTAALGTETKKDVTVRGYIDSNLVAETVVTVNVNKPVVAKIQATRDGSYEAHLSFEGLEDSDIVKAYYVIKDTSDPKPTAAQLIQNAKVFEGLNNACDNKKLDATEAELPSHKGARVYFVVEDSYGNQSDVYTAVVPTDEGATQAKPAKGADDNEYKDKVKVSDNLAASWRASEDGANKYVVRVYDGSGKLLKEYDNVGGTSQNVSDSIKEAGKYTVEVVTKGASDGSTTDSEPIKSEVIEVKKLDSVTDITFKANESDKEQATLSWKDIEHKDDKAAKYTILIEKYDGEKWVEANEVTGEEQGLTIPAEKLEVNLSGIAENTLYRATITVEAASGQKVVLSSEPTVSEMQYFVIGTSVITVGATTDKSVTLNVDKEALKKLGDREYTYEVEIYEAIDPNKPYENRQPETRTVTPNADGNLVIDGLKEGTQYAFVVKMKSGDVVGESSREAGDALNAETKLTAPVVKGIVTKDKAEAQKDGSKVYFDEATNKLIINKEEKDLSNTAKYSDPDKLLDIAKILLKQLSENDEIVSINKDEVTVINGQQAKSMTLDFSSIKDTEGNNMVKTLKVQGNKWNQTISSVQGADKVVLANGGEFDINGLANVKVELEEGAHVLNASTQLTLLSGANVKVNGVDIVAKNGAVLTPNGKTFTFEPSEDASSTIDINNKSGENVTVVFNSNAKLGNRQLGKVTITSNAKVTVQATGTATASDVKVSTTDGDVDVKDAGLTGNIDVTVSTSEDKTNEITANAKEAAPFEADGTFEIREYTDKELEEGNITGLIGYSYSEEKAQQLKDYLQQFKTLFGKGIKLKVDAGSKEIKLIVPENVTVSVTTEDVLGIKAQ